MVARFFKEQAKCVRTVSVVIDHENPKNFPVSRQNFLFSPIPPPHGLKPVVNRRSFYPVGGCQVAFSVTSAKSCRTFSKSAGLTR